MFKLKTNKVYEVPKDHHFFRDSDGIDFPVKKLVIEKYGYSPCYVYLEDLFSNDLLVFLLKNANLIQYRLSGSIEDLNKYQELKNSIYLFEYNDFFIKLTAKPDYDNDTPMFTSSGHLFSHSEVFPDKKNIPSNDDSIIYTVLVYIPANIQNYNFDEFKKFIVYEKNTPKVHLFIKNSYGDYGFEPISVNLPENLDLEINYGSKFLEFDKTIKKRLVEKTSGLYMFHGPPGTGKTTYIKHLAYTVDRDFIYIPTSMIEFFTTDPNCLNTLIQKPNSVIILEDAEKAILKRVGDGMDSSAVSSLLNLSDGIMSDILKTSVIVTYNCPKQDIDDALKRKGRLQAEYEFANLDVDEAKKLAKKLKYPKALIEDKITQPMSISDIYNLESQIEFYGKAKRKEPNRIIGFGNS